MRYSELRIETQRQAPARARSEGESLLKRAGYLSGDGEPTPLGRRSLARLEELAQTMPPAQMFEVLELPTIRGGAGAYFLPIATGRLNLMECPSCGYAAPQGTARFKKAAPEPESPAPIEKVLTPDCPTIEALAAFLGLPKTKTAKALMYTRSSDRKFVFVVVRGDMQLSEAKLQGQVGEVRAATNEEIVAAGAAPGYASPIGLKDALVVIDDLIPTSPNLVAGANEQGYHLKNTNYGRDYAAHFVADLVLAEPQAPCPNCGHAMSLARAELIMDAQGLHTGNVLQALADIHHDGKGLTMPAAGAPFVVYLLHVPGKDLDTRAQATRLHDEWEAAGIPVLFDDRDERAGVKFNDADLIGCPVRATVGERSMKDGMVELKARPSSEAKLAPFAETIPMIQQLTKKAA